MLANLIEVGIFFDWKYLDIKEAVNVSPAPDTSMVSFGDGDLYMIFWYLAPCLPKVVIILSPSNSGLLVCIF